MAERMKFNEDAEKLGAVQCPICIQAAASVVLVPCNHLMLCEKCYADMLQRSKKIECPMCRLASYNDKVFHLQM